jgi:hypothetical protein
MKQSMKNGGNGTNGLVSRLAAEKKKTVTAVCLVAIMVVMWARMLSKEAPSTAAAALREEDVKQDRSDTELNITFIELPKVEGRNDVMKRDFFVVDDWQKFMKSGESENKTGVENVSVVSGPKKKTMERIAAKLKIEAIVLDGNPQVFINNILLSVGDKLLVKDGGNTYECEVVCIEENMVLIKCGEAEITKKITKAVEVMD